MLTVYRSSEPAADSVPGFAVHASPVRAYRERCTPRDGEAVFQVAVRESDLRVTCCAEALPHLPGRVRDHLLALRAELEGWIARYPAFRASLVPVPLPANVPAPPLVRAMTRAAARAGVGPFAAVAGAIAQATALAMLPHSPELLVENGGDICLCSRQDRVVGLLPHPDEGVTVGLLVAGTPEATPVCLCASSATIGHSLSFGRGELAVVRAADGALADALATAFGNALKHPDDVKRLLKKARRVTGLDGIFLQCGEAIGLWGRMELTAV